jgi:pyruvate-formate lyase-activating enzyme
MLGCDYHCPYCQNWLTSQALRDPAAGSTPTRMTPKALVGMALSSGARVNGQYRSFKRPRQQTSRHASSAMATQPSRS